jgi:hypothetical protein
VVRSVRCSSSFSGKRGKLEKLEEGRKEERRKLVARLEAQGVDRESIPETTGTSVPETTGTSEEEPDSLR